MLWREGENFINSFSISKIKHGKFLVDISSVHQYSTELLEVGEAMHLLLANGPHADVVSLLY